MPKERASAAAGAEAIRRALEAEQQAGRDVQQAAAEAEALVERGRARARAISALADHRIERIPHGSGRGTAARVEAIRERARVELERLGRPVAGGGSGCAACRVARWLTTPAGSRADDPPDEPADARP
ncbi:MAG TPA: hypothetical protein VFA86_11685 [Gammaproteobacteria bacterium]|nr:hypothetical protein [Gammaproteobacteria bacterium]